MGGESTGRGRREHGEVRTQSTVLRRKKYVPVRTCKCSIVHIDYFVLHNNFLPNKVETDLFFKNTIYAARGRKGILHTSIFKYTQDVYLGC